MVKDRPSVLGVFEALDSPYITVHQTRCVVVRNRNARCMRCADACTSQCISYEDGQLIINPERCVGCGTCATVCPTCALEAHHPSDAELSSACEHIAREQGGKQLSIACDEVFSAHGPALEGRAARVTCLGRVEESLLARLAASGIEQTSLVHGDCASCERVKGLATAEAVCSTAKTLIETWGGHMGIELTDALPEGLLNADEGACAAPDEAPGVDAPAEPVQGGEPAVGGKASAAEEEPVHSKYLKVMADGTLPHFIPDRRERLLDALALIGKPADVDIDVRLWGHVFIDDELCSACQMCAVFCPTGAISKFTDDNGLMGVEHRAADCVKCRCCEDICLEGSLRVEDVVHASDIETEAVERHVMQERSFSSCGPHSMMEHMKDIIGSDQVYER